MNGKGDKPRPLSVTQNKFSDNWDLIFAKKEICEYSGLLSTASYDSIDPTYIILLKSGLFWELHPTLSGIWDQDKDIWNANKTLQQNGENNETPERSNTNAAE